MDKPIHNRMLSKNIPVIKHHLLCASFLPLQIVPPHILFLKQMHFIEYIAQESINFLLYVCVCVYKVIISLAFFLQKNSNAQD